jgi:XTP/dITP diphosphohydrolase
MKVVFASNNKHKLDEVRAIIGDSIELLSLSDIHFTDELPETSGTIKGNAEQKAQTLFNSTGLPCFADDTGLEVFALNGEPGVDSAHYAGPQRDSKDNMKKLLSAMDNKINREARFLTVIAFVDKNGVKIFEGEVRGYISLEPKGLDGFGYDPVFMPEGYSKSFAELDSSIKNSISHRARAVEQMKNYFHTMQEK